MVNTNYYPEGYLINTVENINATKTKATLSESMLTGRVLEGRAMVCDSEHNLIVDLPCMKGIIPRVEGAIGISDGTTRDIALISKVNKPVCFKVVGFTTNSLGQEVAVLSRRLVQEECLEHYISKLTSGDVIDAKVTHLEQFGCFVDIGCGIPSLIPIDAISVSRISHPADRFYVNQNIKAVVKDVCGSRVWLSHKELLGTWEENASQYNVGETVAGVVRSVESYGIFIELTPNLAGLSEFREGVSVGQNASVYIKALIPEKMKVKLVIVDVFNAEYPNPPIEYYVHSDHIDYWKYTTEVSTKLIETRF
jgi:small subunit ribosomal protein S1